MLEHYIILMFKLVFLKKRTILEKNLSRNKSEILSFSVKKTLNNTDGIVFA
jgi:hypothetical protein